jgi:hypothetical protein
MLVGAIKLAVYAVIKLNSTFNSALDPIKKQTMTTVLFVHGTGVRQPGYEETFKLIEQKLQA